MAVKTKAPVKKPVATKVAPKATLAKKTVAAKKTAPVRKAAGKTVKGDRLECGVCGLAVTVDEISGYAEETVILCCDKPMKPRKKAAVKAKK